jgi:hypothetical protein
LRNLKRFLFLSLALLLGTAGFLFWKNGFFSPKIDPYRLIPGNSVFVFETREAVREWNQFVSQPFWEGISDIPVLKSLESQLLRMDSLAGKGGALERTWRGKQFLVSLHPTGKEEFDFLFAVGFEDGRVPELLRLLESHIAPENQPKSRNYSGVTIWEYQPELSQRTLTYGIYRNVLVASFTSFLTEDAIRTAKSGDHQDFKGTYPRLFQGRLADGGVGQLRIASKGLGSLIRGVSSILGDELAGDLESLEFGAILRPSYSENTFSLIGSTVSFGSAMFGDPLNSAPSANEVFNQISNRTAVMRVLDTQHILDGATPATRSHKVKSTVFADVQREFDHRAFFDGVSQQAIYMALESPNTEALDRVLVLPVKKSGQSFQLVKNYVQVLLKQENVQQEMDVHLGKEIIGIGVEAFPLHVYNGVFDGFNRTYVTESNGFLVFANSLRVLKNYLDDLYNDNTWGKSVSKMVFANRFNGNKPFVQWVDLPKFHNQLVRSTTPNWSSVFQKYGASFGTLSLFSVEVGTSKSLENLRISFEFGAGTSSPSVASVLTLSSSTRFNFPLTYGPTALMNFTDRSTEYLVQDERNTVYLVGPEGNLVFSHELDFPVISEVFQIDFFKNEKLQLIFACEDGLYGFDRLGNVLPGYPIPLPQGRRLAYMNLVDYELNKDYRYFVADELGDLYLIDKRGKLLEGWAPKHTTGPLADRPAHHRVLGIGDVMVSLHKNGSMELMTRRGESRTGNPLKLGEGVDTHYGLTDRGGASSQLVTVNTSGEVVSVNFNGELTYRSQLLRPDRETSFHLVNNQQRDGFLIVLHEFNKITVLNANESPLFEYPILSDDLHFQWFSFGYEKDVFVVVDRVQEFCYLFDLKGDLLIAKPIESTGPISVTHSPLRNEYVIALIYANQLRTYKLPL